jgi:hypothetical protein
MSNETLQEKHPKFYKDPHLWIGAIEVECVKCFMRPVGMGVSGYNEGEIIKLTPQNYDWLKTPRIIECVKPIFKPQEGEQFIKDLESAVRVATGFKFEYKEEYKGYLRFKYSHLQFICNSKELNKATLIFSEDTNIHFDTAAYVDTLRKLGYYL